MRSQRFRLPLRHVSIGLPLLLGVSGVASSTAAADKAALVCIQSAEQGQTARNSGALLHARELFSRCAAQDCPRVLRHDCSSWLEDDDRQIPSIVLGAHDADGHDVVDARASIDGAVVRQQLDGNPIELDPGTHAIHFEKTGVPAVDIQVVVRAGEKSRPILATLAPPPAPTPPPATPPSPSPTPAPSAAVESGGHIPPGAWVLGGLGVAAMGVFGYFGVRGTSDANNLRSTCAPGCQDSQVQNVRTELIAADVGLGVGAVSLGAALWIGIRGLTSTSNPSGWNLVVAPSTTGARMGVETRF